MAYIDKLADNGVFWMFYFVISGTLALGSGILWVWRKSGNNEHWSESTQNVIWNATIHFFGFVLFFIQIQLLSLMAKTSSTGGKTVVGIIFLVMFFYSIFCLSGRGIEIFEKILREGVKEIHIGWKGITIKFGE